MPNENGEIQMTKAAAFFQRARKVAETNNFDYAIDMYLEGIRCVPDSLEDGHKKLRQIALTRCSKGGKKPSMIEKVKLARAKTPLDRLLNAAYLFAKDPNHLSYAEMLLKAAAEGDYKKTAKWIADLLFAANNANTKPSLQTYLLLKESYEQIEEYDRALSACQSAVKLKPQDAELADELQRLSTELTVSRGKYDQEGDFRNSIKDREKQEKLYSQDRIIKSDSYRTSALEEAQKAYKQDMELPKNIINLAKVLAEEQDDKSYSEAVALLGQAYEKTSDFSYEQLAGQIKIGQVKRKTRKAKKALRANAEDHQAKEDLEKSTEQLNAVELEHYDKCVKNYPTDLEFKYEYGTRLVRNKQYDDAIPLLQEAQRDPRRKIPAMSKIGMCFFNKTWFADAIDIFKQAIEIHEATDDNIAKELRYNLARAHEKLGETDDALGIYRKIAQLDFSYKDVRGRIDKLRNSHSDEKSQ